MVMGVIGLGLVWCGKVSGLVAGDLMALGHTKYLRSYSAPSILPPNRKGTCKCGRV